MRVLILGGTGFLGTHIVDAFLEGEHCVTCFNRGRTKSVPRAGVESVRGDRRLTHELSQLGDREFDVVVDTNGYTPTDVAASARLLRDRCGTYVFVSTVSAYRDLAEHGIDERSSLAVVDPGTTVVSPDSYGPLKAACEREVRRAVPGRNLIVRPGLITGPGDVTGRVSAWILSISSAPRVFAPGDGNDRIQLIDARDVGEFLQLCADRGTTGTFNLVGPSTPLTFRDFLALCEGVAGRTRDVTWVPEDALAASDLLPWVDIPLWNGAAGSKWSGFMTIDGTSAQRQGLSHRPVRETLSDLWSVRERTPLREEAAFSALLAGSTWNSRDASVVDRGS